MISTNLLAEIKISGVVKTSNNMPLEGADVYAFVRKDLTSDAINTSTTDKNGNYEIILDDKYLYFGISFTAPNYDDYRFTICGVPNLEYKIDVTLSPLYIPYLSDSISVIGDFNNFDMYENAIRMTKLENGNYIATIPNTKDTLGYQILFDNEYERKSSINGQQANFYKLDAEGHYVSYIISKEPKIKIEFNTSKVIAKQPPSFAKSDNPAIEKIIGLEDVIFNSMVERDMAIQKLLEADEDMEYEIYNEIRYRPVKLIDTLFANTTEIEVKTYLANSYLDRLFWGGGYNEKEYPYNKEIMNFIKNNFPITSNFFIGYNCPIRIEFCKLDYRLENDESLFANKLFQEYFKSVDKNSREYVGLLQDIVEDYMQQKDTNNARIFYDSIKKIAPTSSTATYITAQYNLDGSKKIIVGNTIPDFELPNVDNPSDTISMQKLRGKWVMIDLWYQGCGPCLAEIPNFRKIYEKYKDKNFVIYSISFDAPETIKKFKSSEKYAMPWLHSYSGEGDWHAPVVRLLETRGVPHCILVAPDGKIVALDGELRGNNLETTLNKLLNE